MVVPLLLQHHYAHVTTLLDPTRPSVLLFVGVFLAGGHQQGHGLNCWVNSLVNKQHLDLSLTMWVWTMLVLSISSTVYSQAYHCQGLHLHLCFPLSQGHPSGTGIRPNYSGVHRFTQLHCKPLSIWSDHGTNVVEAARELKEFSHFLKERGTQTSSWSFAHPTTYLYLNVGLVESRLSWIRIPPRAFLFLSLWKRVFRHTVELRDN